MGPTSYALVVETRRMRQIASMLTAGEESLGHDGSFRPDETWSRQAVRCSRIPGHSIGERHDAG